MFLGNDSDKFPNLSKSLGGDSVQVKPDQIKVLRSSVRNITNPEHAHRSFSLVMTQRNSKNLSKSLGGDSVTQAKHIKIKTVILITK
jgi:hypothetical protein